MVRAALRAALRTASRTNQAKTVGNSGKNFSVRASPSHTSTAPRGLLASVRVEPAAVRHEVLEEGVLLAPVPLAGHLLGLLLQQLLLLGYLRRGFSSDL